MRSQCACYRHLLVYGTWFTRSVPNSSARFLCIDIRSRNRSPPCLVMPPWYATIGFGNLLLQAEPWLARQVGFNERLVLGVSDRDIARNRQVVSGLLRISQGSK